MNIKGVTGDLKMKKKFFLIKKMIIVKVYIRLSLELLWTV